MNTKVSDSDCGVAEEKDIEACVVYLFLPLKRSQLTHQHQCSPGDAWGSHLQGGGYGESSGMNARNEVQEVVNWDVTGGLWEIHQDLEDHRRIKIRPATYSIPIYFNHYVIGLNKIRKYFKNQGKKKISTATGN